MARLIVYIVEDCDLRHSRWIVCDEFRSASWISGLHFTVKHFVWCAYVGGWTLLKEQVFPRHFPFQFCWMDLVPCLISRACFSLRADFELHRIRNWVRCEMPNKKVQLKSMGAVSVHIVRIRDLRRSRWIVSEEFRSVSWTPGLQFTAKHLVWCALVRTWSSPQEQESRRHSFFWICWMDLVPRQFLVVVFV